MNLKLDFVTNSSSAAYIISMHEDDLKKFEDFIHKMDSNPDYSGEGVSIWKHITTKKDLYEYATEKSYDWISKAMTPISINLEQNTFESCLDLINKRLMLVFVSIDYSACNEFERSEYANMIIDEL